MKKFIFLLFFISNNVYAQSTYWQQQNDFKINVTLNDIDHTLKGFEEITYYNNSPDTLSFIWIHIWPNAFKNDRTAFSDQLLQNGRTDFYFSKEKDRGYVNQLNFKVDQINTSYEDHPEHQDIIKLLLPKPLAPLQKIKIETPFHVKIPYNFSRGGHVEQSYQFTQWYPKPAVYDKDGWHPIPYLDQGEFYSNFGIFNVQITLPSNYIVAATGKLQNKEEEMWLTEKANEIKKLKKIKDSIPSSNTTKTIQFIQENVHDFAWFADKSFIVKKDTLNINTEKTIDIYSFILPENVTLWKNSLAFTKLALKTKSNWLGMYPYSTMSVVDSKSKFSGGMEYPTITLLTANNEKELEYVINHEVGHNWFYGILATNERKYPWMDEGMNTFYDDKYIKLTKKDAEKRSNLLSKKNPLSIEKMLLETIVKLKLDQPIATNSELFNQVNYGLIAYVKAGNWLQKLESKIGIDTFDIAMKTYYNNWKFKHPTLFDFKKIIDSVSNQNNDSIFNLLNTKGSLEKTISKKIKLSGLYNLKETNKFNYINILPVFGANLYDKFMIGAAIHNYSLPLPKFHFFIAPMYSSATKKLNGISKISFQTFVGKKDNTIMFNVSASKFTGNIYKDSTNTKNPLQFSKISPSIKYIFAKKNPLSSVKRYLEFQTFFINETTLLFKNDASTGQLNITYPKENRYVNRLKYEVENNRVLYPYNLNITADQGDLFFRIGATANQYFNFENGGGINVRLFAGKFIYLTNKSFTNSYKTDIYHLNLTGPRGYEDYTYSNYFVGRNAFEGFASQQLMNRDGFFKVGTDYLSSKVGKSDDWLASINLNTTIPDKINILNALPIKIPVKLFLDLGTYAEAWKQGSNSGKFLYDAGLQFSLFKNVLNVYVPIVYSKVYKNYFKSTITEKTFQKTISFNIDISKLKISNFFPQAGL